MLDLIASSLKALASFSKDFRVWMEWEKSDIGTIVQYEEVGAVQVLVWFSLEEVLTQECPLLHSHMQEMLLHRAP